MPTAPNKRKHDPALDRLIARNIRCPYCSALIAKFTTDCAQCGITKQQIARASNVEAKKIIKSRGREKGKVLLSRHRPEDLKFAKFLLLLVFLGMFGAHNFYCGRRIRGHIMLWFMVPPSIWALFWMDHPWRLFFETSGMPFPLDAFPTDYLVVVAIIMWLVDWFSVVISNRYKYPVRIKTD